MYSEELSMEDVERVGINIRRRPEKWVLFIGRHEQRHVGQLRNAIKGA